MIMFGSFFPGLFGWFAPPKFTRVQGADIVMESITPTIHWPNLPGTDSCCKRLWRLKNSRFQKSGPNFGYRKRLTEPRKSFIGHPDAIQFLRISGKRVFQRPQAIAPTIQVNEADGDVSPTIEKQRWGHPEIAAYAEMRCKIATFGAHMKGGSL